MMSVIDEPDRRAILTPVAWLEFVRTGDRWVHRLYLEADGSAQPLASSLEAPEQAEPGSTPPSPTYQEVRLWFARHDQPQVLCLGRFGQHHYAATFAVRYERDVPGSPPGHPEGSHPTTIIEVDVADRSPEGVEPLAATYTVHSPPSALAWASAAGACWQFDPGPVLAVFEQDPSAGPGHQVQVDEAGRAACRAQVLVSPTSERTLRLKYSWLLTDHSKCPLCASNQSGGAG